MSVQDEKRLMAEIKRLEGPKRMEAIRKAIEQFEGKLWVTPFLEEAIGYYEAIPDERVKALPYISKALHYHKRGIKESVVTTPITFILGLIFVFWLPGAAAEFGMVFWGQVASAIGGGIFLLASVYSVATGARDAAKLLRLRHRFRTMSDRRRVRGACLTTRGTGTFPRKKVWKLWELGEEGSVAYWYEVLKSGLPRRSR